MIETLELTALSLAWLLAIFIPLEWAAPAWPGQPRRRIGWLADLGFFLGQYLLFGSIAVAVLAALDATVGDLGVLASARAMVDALPLAVQLGLALVLGDILVYWGHRLQHASDLLWRFHSVHHTAEKLDFLAAHREHPVDGIYTQTLMNLPAIALGLPLEHALGLVAFRSLWAIFIHANVRLELGVLGLVFGDPRLHHWHHAKARDAGNYANLAPWLDLLFGTYHRPRTEPTDLGIDEPHPRGYFSLLAYPLLPRARRMFRR